MGDFGRAHAVLVLWLVVGATWLGIEIVRLSVYDCHFTRSEDHTAAWWKRDCKGCIQPLSLGKFRR